MSGFGRLARLGMFLVAAVAALAACDSTTEPAKPLTLEETEALYLGMQELFRDTAPEIISSTEDGGVFACPLGGQVTAAFDAREETAPDTARLVTNVTFEPVGCVLSSGGSEFTLDGNPNVLSSLTIAIVVSTFEFFVEGSTTGGLDWQLDDRSGTCMIDLALSAEVDPSGPEPVARGIVSGTMCGLEVEFNEDVGISGT